MRIFHLSTTGTRVLLGPQDIIRPEGIKNVVVSVFDTVDKWYREFSLIDALNNTGYLINVSYKPRMIVNAITDYAAKIGLKVTPEKSIVNLYARTPAIPEYAVRFIKDKVPKSWVYGSAVPDLTRAGIIMGVQGNLKFGHKIADGVPPYEIYGLDFDDIDDDWSFFAENISTDPPVSGTSFPIVLIAADKLDQSFIDRGILEAQGGLTVLTKTEPAAQSTKSKALRNLMANTKKSEPLPLP